MSFIQRNMSYVQTAYNKIVFDRKEAIHMCDGREEVG